MIDREKDAARKRAYYQENIEKERSRSRLHYQKNREKRIEQIAEARRKRKQRIAAIEAAFRLDDMMDFLKTPIPQEVYTEYTTVQGITPETPAEMLKDYDPSAIYRVSK